MCYPIYEYLLTPMYDMQLKRNVSVHICLNSNVNVAQTIPLPGTKVTTFNKKNMYLRNDPAKLKEN